MSHAQDFPTDEASATRMDETDPLRGYREKFHIPTHTDGTPQVYFCGNSLGLMPKSARAIVDEELDAWARTAGQGHFKRTRGWYAYHELFRESGARLVGARPGEVVMMNTLTVNLHLMLVSFFRPTSQRYKILIEDPAFPSDNYAVRTHLGARGLDPRDALLIARPQAGRETIRTEEIEAILRERGREIALVMLPGVNFLTGQVFDTPRITEAAHRAGCMVGFDLAHAAGNIVMQLHDWDVDFAVWCSYKYLNCGPGAVAGCFVHEKHGKNTDLPRYAGWWGNDPETRFDMQLRPEFVPRTGADGWQISNPPILSLAPMIASLELFDAATMPALRHKSQQLTAFLRGMIEQTAGERIRIITPREPEAHGCQLSLVVRHRPRELQAALQEAGVVCDFREPNVIRAAPAPLYNTFHDVWRFGQILSRTLN
ncbi:MAG: kynureninase [Tepidisphaeraceae bacterium]